MISKDALEYLSAQTLAANRVSELLDYPFAFVPQGFEVRSMDEFNEHASHFRQQFATNHIDSFVDYFDQHVDAADPLTCFVSIKPLQAEIIFDAGNAAEPGHRLHRARLVLDKSPLMQTIENIAVFENLSQRTLAEWLEDWRFDISAEDTKGDDIELRKVITAVRNFGVLSKAGTEHKDESLAASRSAFAEIEAKNKSDLPAFLVGHGEPYTGLPMVDMPMRLHVRLSTDGHPPTFKLQRVRPDQLDQQIAESFVATLKAKFGERTISLLIGTV